MKSLLEKLETFLMPLCKEGVALAFSGGVDSTLLLAVLSRMQKKTAFPLLVLNAVSTLQSVQDKEAVDKAALEYGVKVDSLSCDVLSLPEVRNNDISRCYHCKKMLFNTMLDFAAGQGISTLLEGSHADDLKAYRPGRKALEELGVVSPFSRLGITKQQIRSLAAWLNVAVAERPASPCLATRFDYGTLLTAEKLQQTAKGEAFLRTLLPANADLRLRVHGPLARIEVNTCFFPLLVSRREEIADTLKKIGFERVTLDLEGFSSGSYDGKLKKKENI